MATFPSSKRRLSKPSCASANGASLWNGIICDLTHRAFIQSKFFWSRNGPPFLSASQRMVLRRSFTVPCGKSSAQSLPTSRGSVLHTCQDESTAQFCWSHGFARSARIHRSKRPSTIDQNGPGSHARVVPTALRSGSAGGRSHCGPKQHRVWFAQIPVSIADGRRECYLGLLAGRFSASISCDQHDHRSRNLVFRKPREASRFPAVG